MIFEKDSQTEDQEKGFILVPESPLADSQADDRRTAQEMETAEPDSATQTAEQSQPEAMAQPDYSQQSSTAHDQRQHDETNQSNHAQGPKHAKVKKTGLLVLLVLCGLSVFAGLKGLLSEHDISRSGGILKEFTGFSTSSSKAHIAVLHIEGTIQDKNDTYDQEWLLTTIRDLSYDRNVKAILLDINSPGGGVYQSDEVYLELLDYKETSGNPVFAFFGPLAASGGYYIACAADYIVANRNTMTGSIGVIAGQSVDLSQFMEKHGVRVNTFTAGRNKDMLGISTPVTPEHREIMQSLADECYYQFVEIVAESRGLTMEETLELADGRIYTAWQALDRGLIDVVGRFDDALYYLREKLDDFSLEPVHYYPEEDYAFMDYVFKNMQALASRFVPTANASDHLLLEAKERMLPDISYPAYYYQP